MASLDSEKIGNRNNLERQVTLSLSAEQYERLFFQPSRARGDAAQRFGNPTLLGVLGFLIPFMVTLFSVLQFQGSSANSLPGISGSYYLGGIAMVLAGIFEFIIGNTYPMCIFIVYGAHWVNTGYSQQPLQGITAFFDTTGPGGVTIPGALSQEFNSSQGHYNAVMAIISFIFLCGSLRTNLPFVLIFFGLVFLFSFFSAAFYQLGYNPTEGGVNHAFHYLKIGGGFGMLTMAMGLYLAIITVCASTGVPCPLPIFDLSQKVFAHSESGQRAEHAGAVSNKTTDA